MKHASGRGRRASAVTTTTVLAALAAVLLLPLSLGGTVPGRHRGLEEVQEPLQVAPDVPILWGNPPATYSDNGTNAVAQNPLHPWLEADGSKHLLRLDTRAWEQTEEEEEEVAEPRTDPDDRPHPSDGEVWGYGLAWVTLISLGSALGATVVPFMNKSFYKWLMMYFLALAVGTLLSNALLQLIPEALGMNPAVFAGFYLFFCTEKILKRLLGHKHHRGSDRAAGREQSRSTTEGNDEAEVGMAMDLEGVVPSKAGGDLGDEELDTPDQTCVKLQNNPQAQQEKSECTVTEEGSRSWLRGPPLASVGTLAWMITIGDGLHNLVDGLAIGASFHTSVVLGVGTSLAILFEELPHELGDFVVLLSSGMSVRQALLFNGLSACCCYLGLALGVLASHGLSSSAWIFGLAAGMFLYISLAAMFPEMKEMEDEEAEKVENAGDGRRSSFLLTFIVQNAGLLTGFTIMLLLTIYSGELPGLGGPPPPLAGPSDNAPAPIRPPGPSDGEVWGYGLAWVTLISLGSALGATVVPFMNKSFYKWLMMYFLALAVGTLLSNALLQLIPEALGMNPAVFAGFYLFFCTEKILKRLLGHKHHRGSDRASGREQSHDSTTVGNDEAELGMATDLEGVILSKAGGDLGDEEVDHACAKLQNNPSQTNHGAEVPLESAVAHAGATALGYSLRNLVSGLAVGASFSVSVRLGLGTSLALLLEAVLRGPDDDDDRGVKCGVVRRLWASCCCDSCCCCVLGLVLSLLGLGLSVLLASCWVQTSPWVLGLVAGMFLYLMADAVPRMSAVARTDEEAGGRRFLLAFAVQNAGLLSGLAVVLMLTA